MTTRSTGSSTPLSAAISVASRRGSLAIIAGLISSSALAVLLHQPSPLEPVASFVMDRTPVTWAIPLLLTLGPLARPLAALGAIGLTLLVGVLLGIVYPSWPSLPRRSSSRLLALLRVVLALACALLLLFVLLPRENPIIAGLLIVTYFLTLTLLQRGQPSSPSRRAFLLHNSRVIAGIAAIVALINLDKALALITSQAAGRPLFSWHPPKARKPGFTIPGLTPEVTPTGEFYLMDEDLQQPNLDLASWRLQISGLVQHPQQLNFADLLTLPRRDLLLTQECISNPVGGPLMSTGLYSGVPIALLLDRARVRRSARAVLFRSPDGHEEALPLSWLLDGQALLAYARDGHLLEREHGFPARVVVPGLYGFKSIKWVTELRVSTDPQAGWWERNGWTPLPRVQTTARIDLARHTAQGLLIAGVALAGRRGIAAVQVRLNGGTWQPCTLHTPALSPLTWVQWRLLLAHPPSGPLTIEARAIDGQGRVQTAPRHQQQPAGATGYHTLTLS